MDPQQKTYNHEPYKWCEGCEDPIELCKKEKAFPLKQFKIKKDHDTTRSIKGEEK